MSHYSSYGFNRTSSSSSSGIRTRPQEHNAYNRKSTDSAAKFHGRPAKGHYPTPVESRTWEKSGGAGRPSSRARPSTYDSGKPHGARHQDVPKSIYHTTQTQPYGRTSELKSDSNYRGASSIGFLQEPVAHRASSPFRYFQYSSNIPSSGWRNAYKPTADHHLLTSYTRTLASDTTRYASLKYTREKVQHLAKSRSQQKSVELTGWRAKLAKEMSSKSANKPNDSSTASRQWHYVDDEDEMEFEAGFVYVFCRGSQTEETKQSLEVRAISRTRKMKLEIQKPKDKDQIITRNVLSQVLVEELGSPFSEKDRKPKRNFISSRYSSWYHGGSYNKYVSAVPWRPTQYSKPRNIPADNYLTLAPKQVTSIKNECRLKSIDNTARAGESIKSYRKSVLNMNLPQEELEVVNLTQKESRIKSSNSRKSRTSSESASSVDGSPNETGYDSTCTDNERRTSDGWTDGLHSVSPLSSDNGVGNDSRYGHFSSDEPPSVGISPLIFLSVGENAGRSPSTISSDNDTILKETDFVFRSISAGSSQRDSGFSELLNRCESPCTNLNASGEELPITDSEDLRKPFSEECCTQGSKYISECHDIDSILLCDDPDGYSSTFEDFERRLDHAKGELRCQTCFEAPKSNIWPWYENEGFIGTYRDIDEMLGVDATPPLEEAAEDCDTIQKNDETDGSTIASSILEAIDVADMSWLDEGEKPLRRHNESSNQPAHVTDTLDDCTLQLYRYNNGSGEGDYGSYLDLESTVDEQQEEFEGFHNNRKNAVVLRTQLSVRVHAIIEKLVNSSGRELRRALFSLKQIFQDDKDLVHEFVQNDGLACLIKVGSEADQNYQNYILRAMGQVMLYVDGMNGVIEHNETIQWLYSLIASKYRLVVKTALKLLLVFVEYTESNSQLFVNAVCIVDSDNGTALLSNIMNLLKEKDSADMELLVYAATLINKTLNGIPDQDTYYDLVDTLEEQGMENVIQYYMSKQGTDLDLLQQFQIYEAVLKHEDGVPDTKPLPLDARLRQVPRSRKSYPSESDRRKSRRHSVGTLSSSKQNNNKSGSRSLEKTPEESPFVWQDRNHRKSEEIRANTMNHSSSAHMNGSSESILIDDENGITPALRRRRERDARNKSLIKEQEQNGKSSAYTRMNSTSSTSSICSENGENSLVKEDLPFQSIVERHRYRFESSVDVENQKNSVLSKTKGEQIAEKDRENCSNSSSELHRPNCLRYPRSDTNKKAWMFSMMYAKSQDEEAKSPELYPIQKVSSPVDNVNNTNNHHSSFKTTREEDTNVKRDGSVKDIQEKFNYRYENGTLSPTSENVPRLGDSSGIISRAKEGLAASSVRPDQKVTSPTESPNSKLILESKKLDSDLQWEQLMKSMKRPLIINDLDFTDLNDEEDYDFLPNGDSGGHPLHEHSETSPPPQPPGLGPPPPPPPLPVSCPMIPPPPPIMPPLPQTQSSLNAKNLNSVIPPPWVRRNQHQELLKDTPSNTSHKTKKTVKLFWREVKEDRSLLKRIGRKKTIWDELKPVPVDTQKLEHLFENRAKDVMNKEKSQETSKKQEIIVLDTKRSNAINIGMKKLPPPRTIKTAILKMDSTIMNREGIEKILTTMLPTPDEKSRIAEAQMSNPDVPLGTAEQFLLTLSSISELEARLRLWAFRLDYDSIEKEVAEPLMDLKQAMNEIESSETFRVILSTLRSVGNFLNGVEIKGFHIEYLAKVPEVKDTVQKHSLLHHLCHIVMEKFPKSSDLYSEIGSVTRSSKVDYAEVTKNLNKMENECKASWDYLKAIAKHDCNITMKVRISEFLTDCAERIIVLKVVHRRMINRYHKFLVYLGCVAQSVEETPVQKVCKILSEFALEYRTTRERVLQQIEKKANHRERNKTRGKMITEMERFRTKEQQADHELRQLLGNGAVNGDDQRTQKWGTVPCHRGRVRSSIGQGGSLGRHSAPAKDEGLTDADDEILETLVKTATTQPTRNEPRTRKKARYGDRKSLRRTLKNGLSDEERHMLSTMTT